MANKLTIEQQQNREVARLKRLILQDEDGLDDGTAFFTLNERLQALKAMHYIPSPKTLPALYDIINKTLRSEISERALELIGWIHDRMRREGFYADWYERGS